MTKQEFIQKRDALKQQLTDICEEYVKTNIVYAPGTKVKVTNTSGKSRIGVVKYTHLSEVTEEDVVPHVMQLTIEGNESLRRIVIYPGDTIEIIK